MTGARPSDAGGECSAAFAEGHESVAHHRGELGAIEGPGSPERTLPQRVNGRAVSGRIVGADVNARMKAPYRLIELLEIGVNIYPGSGMFTKIGSIIDGSSTFGCLSPAQTAFRRLSLEARGPERSSGHRCCAGRP